MTFAYFCAILNILLGLKRCRDLAQVHAEKAIEAILALEHSIARDSLVALACKVVAR